MAEDYTTRAVLTASVGQFIAGFKEAKATYQDFNQSMARSSMASTDAVANSSKLISGAMKVSAVAVTGLSVAALKTGADFEHQMSRVGAIAGASGKDLKELNDQAIKLGADTAFSAKEAAGGMENLASAGMNSKQIMAAMPGVLNLAAVSGGDVALSAENAATALNGFGLEAKDSAHVADVFARAAADTNAEASDMGEALKMVAPQAHGAGLSLEETAAAIGVLSDAGIKGSMAGSNLGMALTRVQNPSKEASGAMAELGFSAYDSSGKMKPLAAQVDELKSKLSGMTDQQKQYYTSQIYGVQGGRAMNVLLQAQSGKLEGLTKSLQNSNGAADEMAKTMQNDLASSVEQLGGSFESTAIILEQTFSGILKTGVDSITDSVGKFNDYLQKNQTHIQATTKHLIAAAGAMSKFTPSIEQVGTALKVVLPSLIALETFKGIGVGGARTVSMLETIQADLSLVQRGLIMTSTAAQSMAGFTIGTFSKIGSATKDAVVNVNSFNNAIMSASAGDKFKGMLTGIANGFTSIPSKAGNAGKAMVSAFTNPQAAATGLNTKMFALLQTVGASDAQIAKLTNTTMKGGTAIGKIGLAGEGASDAMLAGATSAGGLGMSLGVLLPIAAAVALVATAIYMAWDSNFMNIQGVVQSAIGGIKSIFDSMRPSISAVVGLLQPIGSLLGGILKVVGAIAIGSIVVSVVALATALRLNVDGLAAITRTAIAAGYAVEGFIQKMIPGGKDGSEAFDKAKKSIDGAKDSVKDMGQAFVDAEKVGIDAASQIGKTTDDSNGKLKAASVSVKDVSKAAKQMKSDFEDSKTKLSDLVNTEGVSDKTKEFLTNVNTTLDQYQSNAEKASEKYKNSMAKAEDETGQARLTAVNKANAQLAQATQANGQNLIAISSDLDRQLQAKKFTDGTAMNNDQVVLLTDQNNKIKQKLIEQNEIFVQAQLARVQNGQKLNETQRQATITTLQSNYQLEAQQVQVGEDKIKQLKQQIDQEKDQTTKAQLQQQLVTQQQHNQSLVQQQQTFGTQMNMAIADGSKLNYQTWSQGLQSMKDVTAPQLQSMYLSFVQMNGDTGQQMQAFALMLQRSGIQGVNNLVQALATGKATTKEVAAALAKDGTDGLNTLPPSMFTKGKDGQAKFIEALKSGDFKGAGKFLADQSSSGANQPEKHRKPAKNNAEAYINEIKSGKNKTKVAAKEMAKSGSEGLKSEKSGYKSAGKSNGSSYTSGVKSENSSARSAGRSLANAAKSGAKGVSFNSVGSQMAAGVAAGIRSNTGAAVSAMASLVAQVNAEAKKKAKIHSPSRLLRDEVGKFLSFGVAEGINAHAYQATNAMSNVMTGVRNAADIKPLNFSFDANSVINPMIADLNINATDSTAVQLLRKLVDKQSVIVLDTGTLVGETKDKFNDIFGQQIQTTGRWS
ncbi:phage tail tape measure protein (plasmid) [Lactobacillus curvatus]|nr:phage tail tape measure protein [Latilactobacillus curvatus]MSD84711.1 phage tail tape measure protein [Latilactobacillus curvatus]MSE23447.1 phage tail tape measure protein [Latilactobacillus curvatus]MSE24911.1 phage tail tape measure protein [Latilactobacillus curvatus]